MDHGTSRFQTNFCKGSEMAKIGASTGERPVSVITDPVHGSSWITGQLRQAIVEGGYTHGEKLPAERQLAAAFGASRTTVRTALDQLEVERLVTRRVGSGTFVNFRAQGNPEDIAELTSPIELIEVRLGIEPNMVRLAVLNATARDIERLALAIDRMDHASNATRNPLMVWVYRQINVVRGHGQWTAMRDKVLTTERIAEYNTQHRALYDAVRSRDTEAAVAIVTNHLHYARRQLVGANSE
jgi:DNA-binding FadR family transcriptional regulator